MFLKNSIVLVTGGAGAIGINLLQRLIKEDVKTIVVIDNLSSGRVDFLPNDKRIVYIPLPKDLSKGSYIVTSTLSFEKDDQLKIAELTFSNDK